MTVWQLIKELQRYNEDEEVSVVSNWRGTAIKEIRKWYIIDTWFVDYATEDEDQFETVGICDVYS